MEICRICRIRTFTCCVLVLFFLAAIPLYAFENHNHDDEVDIVVLPSTAVVNNDYFAYGRSVEISGTVNGDVYVFGGQVFIDGVVNGDVLVAGGTVDITGKISHDVRLLGGQAQISGEVGRNVTAVTATIEFAPGARIGQNIVILSGNVDLESRIGRNARIYASNVRISDGVNGNVTAYVGQMRLTSKAEIGGELQYWSNKNALIDSRAKVQGGVVHHPSFFYGVFHGKFFKSLKIGSKFAALLMNFFYSLVIALIIIRYFPQRIDRTIWALNHKPLQAIVAGLVLIIVLPLAFLALLITILGVPFALTLLSITVVSFYTAKVLSILWLSKHIFRKFDFQKHMRLYFTFGLIIYFLLTIIPYAGGVISFAALLLGLGGAALGKVDKPEQKIT